MPPKRNFTADNEHAHNEHAHNEHGRDGRDTRRSLSSRTGRGQRGPFSQEMMTATSSHSFEIAQPSSENHISSRPTPIGGLEETVNPASLSLPQHHTASSMDFSEPSIRSHHQQNQNLGPVHYPLLQQPAGTFGGPFDYFSHPYQTVLYGLPIGNTFPAGNMGQQFESRDTHGATTHGAIVMQSVPRTAQESPCMQGSASERTMQSMPRFGTDTPLVPSSLMQGSASQHRMQPLHPPPSVARASTFSFDSAYTGTEVTAPPSQESGMVNWDRDGNNIRVKPAETKSARKKMTESQKAHRRALRQAGGACETCRKGKKKCTHKDLQLGQSQNQAVRSNSNKNHRRQSSSSRTIVAEEQPKAPMPSDSADSSSYRPPTRSDLTVFTSSGSTAAPSDATSIAGNDAIHNAHMHHHGENLAQDIAGFGHQFDGQLLYPAAFMDMENLVWGSTPDSYATDNTIHL